MVSEMLWEENPCCKGLNQKNWESFQLYHRSWACLHTRSHHHPPWSPKHIGVLVRTAHEEAGHKTMAWMLRGCWNSGLKGCNPNRFCDWPCRLHFNLGCHLHQWKLFSIWGRENPAGLWVLKAWVSTPLYCKILTMSKYKKHCHIRTDKAEKLICVVMSIPKKQDFTNCTNTKNNVKQPLTVKSINIILPFDFFWGEVAPCLQTPPRPDRGAQWPDKTCDNIHFHFWC